jgi:prepilin-type N-terminal cleavage/methylation domain-containing protein
MKALSAKAKISGFTLIELFVVLAVLAVANQAAAQSSQFFRISGPSPTSITAFNSDGTLVWSNAMVGTNYTIQTVAVLPGNWVDYVQLPVTSSINTNFIFSFNPPAGMTFIPAGIFTMGNSTGDSDITDAIPTNIYVSGFYMDVNLVSYSQWQSVYNWATNHSYRLDNPGSGKAADHPVQTVDWWSAVVWCNARSQQAGLVPVYYTDAGLTQVFTNQQTADVYVNWTNSGYRLPTEAEWEKAARGGLSGQRFPWGDTISESQANYYGDTNVSYDLGPNGYNAAFTNGVTPYTSPVGYFAPNGYGLYDMAGNVFEWCWDLYGTPYGQPTTTNPTGPAASEYGYRVLRGGDWGDLSDLLSGTSYGARCANRSDNTPSGGSNRWGFRCVRRQ